MIVTKDRLTNKRETLTYYQFNEAALNCFEKQMVEMAENLSFKMVGTSQLQTVTLAEVLDKYLPPAQPIDFLNVDVEGLDEQEQHVGPPGER